jgi:hypothetical protein
LFAGGLKVLKDMHVLLIVRKTDVEVGCAVPLFQVIGLTDDVGAIRRFKDDHPGFVSVGFNFSFLVFFFEYGLLVF